MNDSLQGMRILLTGASRGVGRAASLALLERGAKVLGVARDAARMQRTEQDFREAGHSHFTGLVLDLTESEAPARLAGVVQEHFGALDVAICNAGVMLHHEGEIMSEPQGILEASLDGNLLAPYRVARALLPLLLQGRQPRLLNVGSGAGTFDGLNEPNIASYRLSKWALHGLTILQARELAGRVHVSGFDPGWVRTDLGGPHAPGTPEEAAAGLLKTLQLPWDSSGRFYKDAQEIPW